MKIATFVANLTTVVVLSIWLAAAIFLRDYKVLAGLLLGSAFLGTFALVILSRFWIDCYDRIHRFKPGQKPHGLQRETMPWYVKLCADLGWHGEGHWEPRSPHVESDEGWFREDGYSFRILRWVFWIFILAVITYPLWTKFLHK